MEQALSDMLGQPIYSLNGDEYTLLKNSATHFPDGIASKLWGKVMLRAVVEAEHQEGRAKQRMEGIDELKILGNERMLFLALASDGIYVFQ